MLVTSFICSYKKNNLLQFSLLKILEKGLFYKTLHNYDKVPLFYRIYIFDEFIFDDLVHDLRRYYYRQLLLLWIHRNSAHNGS